MEEFYEVHKEMARLRKKGDAKNELLEQVRHIHKEHLNQVARLPGFVEGMLNPHKQELNSLDDELYARIRALTESLEREKGKLAELVNSVKPHADKEARRQEGKGWFSGLPALFHKKIRSCTEERKRRVSRNASLRSQCGKRRAQCRGSEGEYPSIPANRD